MKVLRFFIELISAPIALIFRTSDNMKVSGKNAISRPLFTFLISLLIVGLIIVYYYRDFIFS